MGLLQVTPPDQIGGDTLTAFRARLRERLIASRGSTYTYKDPDRAADRAGYSIGDDGSIIKVGIPRSSVITAGKKGKDTDGPNRAGGDGGVVTAGPVGGGPPTSSGYRPGVGGGVGATSGLTTGSGAITARSTNSYSRYNNFSNQSGGASREGGGTGGWLRDVIDKIKAK